MQSACIRSLQAADPLFDAIRRADTPAVKRLLDNGSSAEARDNDNIPVLLSATIQPMDFVRRGGWASLAIAYTLHGQ